MAPKITVVFVCLPLTPRSRVSLDYLLCSTRSAAISRSLLRLKSRALSPPAGRLTSFRSPKHSPRRYWPRCMPRPSLPTLLLGRTISWSTMLSSLVSPLASVIFLSSGRSSGTRLARSGPPVAVGASTLVSLSPPVVLGVVKNPLLYPQWPPSPTTALYYVPLDYKPAISLLTNLQKVHGGSPWGAGTFAGPGGFRQPSALEL